MKFELLKRGSGKRVKIDEGGSGQLNTPKMVGCAALKRTGRVGEKEGKRKRIEQFDGERESNCKTIIGLVGKTSKGF